MNFIRRILAEPVLKLTRISCVFALVGLALMAYSLLDPRASPVIVAMSVGHVFGIGAFSCYLLAIVLDVKRGGHLVVEAQASDRTSTVAHTSRPGNQPATDNDR